MVKILNNNALLAIDSEQIEYVYMAKGIGFQNKVDQPLQDVEGQKKYKLSTEQKENSKDVAEYVDMTYLEISADIIALAQKKFPSADENILIPLADHIAIAIHRINNGIEIANPFASDIKLLFPEEYAIAEGGKKIIKERLGVEINGDEVSYITLHIHSAISAEHIDLSLRLVRVIKEFVENIEEDCGVEVNYSTITYSRFVTHIKFMVSRIYHKEDIHLDMNDYAKENLPYAYGKAEKLTGIISEILDCEIQEVEVGYLAIHIERVIKSFLDEAQ